MTQTSVPTLPPGNTTSFHISIYNACQNDVRVRLGDPNAERSVYLFKRMRETIKGTNEVLYLIDDHGKAVATYQPSQGKQNAKVTEDCTAIVREY